MDPSFVDGDLVIGNKLDKNYQFGDVVIYESNGQDRIGRIAAQGNQKVVYGNGVIEVDGTLHPLDEVKDKSQTTVPGTNSDSCFIVSDGKEEPGYDSITCGAIDKSKIKAKCFWLFRCRDL